jgi:uncharacterized protein with PIN domain
VIRFHLDEHIATAIADGLRLHGIDVTTTIDVRLEGADDEDHIRFAADQGRVILTNDRDFLAHHDRGVAHAGIAYYQQQQRSIGEVIQYLVLMDACLSPDEMVGRVEFI